MEIEKQEPLYYVYTYAYHEDDASLCHLEMRSLFGYATNSFTVDSTRRIEPSRSPFMNERMDVLFSGESLDDLKSQLDGFVISQSTFKVMYVINPDLAMDEKIHFDDRRLIEREVGQLLQGQVDLKKPDNIMAIMKGREGWIFGSYLKAESIWLRHQKKPNNYSTALSTRLARAVVNIAAPNPSDVKIIDPCCGGGTVLVEALSMGIDIVGNDVNPLVTTSARENVAYFGYETEITLNDMREVTGEYDVVIIDMPYNLCSVLTPKTQLEMLQRARKLAPRMVVVTIETIDSLIEEAGFSIIDRCEAKKSRFIRQVLVCE
ncbi:TRM11 family SAM-dependent methyltransferase [Bacillus sp. FJAT-45037]|uniref:TRM11 family SAM-dependent methyltransferase n=1 Tax=Bacillus sp. FJAT-45037 TaxID=2011007 RepID=UPI001E3CE594|nr:RsmD family RNA methyltransferase [Bacillus sp. FJAT-45037]